MAGTFDARQGYLIMPMIGIPSRPNRGGRVQVLLDPIGDVQLDNFMSTDLRVQKDFSVPSDQTIEAMFDVFNLFNASTVLGRRTARFGLRVTF